MVIGHSVETKVAAGTGFSLLVALSRAGEGDDPTGETWLNLLGVPLDAGPPFDAERLVDAVRELDPIELRRCLLGRYSWSWCTLVGPETIERAAAGDATAFPALLEHPRYYAGRAREALSVLLPLEPAETKRRLLSALEAAPPPAAEATAEAGRAAGELLGAEPALEAIERLTGGYRYVPEPEAERVLLVPHSEPSPWLVLAQHRSARLIVYSAPPGGSADERLAAIGQALADPKRVEILRLLGRAPRGVAELVRETGLARSTVHHHLAKLREARLVDLGGNARAYRYAARRDAADELAELLAGVVEPR
jgi:DNA-binding transcriptional ArsR family regulator